MSPKALFVDDERWRHDLFEERMREPRDGRGPYDVYHAFTLDQFKALIARHVFSLVSFDYDLVEPEVTRAVGGETGATFLFLGKPRYCGLDCVNALLAQPADRWPATVVVHSWNSRGAGEMMARLREAGLDPVRESFESKQSKLADEAEERFRARCEKGEAHGGER